MKIQTLIAAAVMASSTGLLAQTYTWRPGDVLGGSGTWDTTTANWNTGPQVAWPTSGTANEAVFGTTAGTVTISGGVTANKLTFNVGGYTVQSSTLTLNGTTPTIEATTGTTNINSALAGTSGFTKTGGGQLNLNGNNSGLSGDINFNNGSFLVVGASGALGNTSNVYMSATPGLILYFATSTAYSYGGNISMSSLTNGGQIFNSGTGNITLTGNVGTSTAYINRINLNAAGSFTFNGTNYIGNGGNNVSVNNSAINITGGVTTTQAANIEVGLGGATNAGQLNISGSGQFIVAGNTEIRIGAGGAAGTHRNGASSLTISDTALFDTGTTTGLFRLGSSFASAATTDSGTINLNGGTLSTNRVITSGTIGDSTFNFNGGVFKATGTSATLSGLDTANIAAGGAFIDTNSFNIAMSQVLSGSGALTKQGNGTLTLGGANTYTGATVINDGVLRLASTGSFAAGMNTLGFRVTNTGSGVLDVENSAFSFSQTINLTLASVSNLTGSWNLFTGSQFGSGDLSLTALTSDLGAFALNSGTWELTEGGRDWTFDQVTGQLNVIPEPSTYVLIAISLTALVIFRRRRHTA